MSFLAMTTLCLALLIGYLMPNMFEGQTGAAIDSKVLGVQMARYHAAATKACSKKLVANPSATACTIDAASIQAAMPSYIAKGMNGAYALDGSRFVSLAGTTSAGRPALMTFIRSDETGIAVGPLAEYLKRTEQDTGAWIGRYDGTKSVRATGRTRWMSAASQSSPDKVEAWVDRDLTVPVSAASLAGVSKNAPVLISRF